MKHLNITPATRADQDVLFKLQEQLFRNHIEEIWGWDEKWQIENFRKEWDEANTMVIHDHENLVGYIQTLDEPDHIYLLNIGIYPQFQNQGIGTKAIEHLKKTAKLEGASIALSVFRTNQRAIPFYQRLGFEVQEKTKTGFKLYWRPTKQK